MSTFGKSLAHMPDSRYRKSQSQTHSMYRKGTTSKANAVLAKRAKTFENCTATRTRSRVKLYTCRTAKPIANVVGRLPPGRTRCSCDGVALTGLTGGWASGLQAQ